VDRDATSTHSCNSASSQPQISYKSNFDLHGEVMEGLHTCLHRMVPNGEVMKGLHTCLHRMVPDVKICSTINHKIERYRDGTDYLALMMLFMKEPH